MNLTIFVIGLVCAAIGAILANSKGRSELLWITVCFVAGFLNVIAGFFAVAVLALLPDVSQSSEPDGQEASETLEDQSKLQEEKKCPQCAELVKREAKICRFCRYEFEDTETPALEASEQSGAPDDKY